MSDQTTSNPVAEQLKAAIAHQRQVNQDAAKALAQQGTPLPITVLMDIRIETLLELLVPDPVARLQYEARFEAAVEKGIHEYGERAAQARRQALLTQLAPGPNPMAGLPKLPGRG